MNQFLYNIAKLRKNARYKNKHNFLMALIGVASLSQQRNLQNGKVLKLAVTSAVFKAAFLRKEHFDEHFQASLRFKTSQSVEQEICQQKIVNFKRKLKLACNGTENIYFSFGD